MIQIIIEGQAYLLVRIDDDDRRGKGWVFRSEADTPKIVFPNELHRDAQAALRNSTKA